MAAPIAAALKDSLRDRLPAEAVSQDTAAFAVDGIEPDVVVSPSNTAEVAATIRCASEHAAALIPWGSGSRMWLGAAPERYTVALSLLKLDQIVEHEPADLTMTAGAGILFSDLQEHLAHHGQWLPLDPPEAGTLGGLLAANASGPARMRHGTARDHVIGMEVVNADGETLKFGGRVVKNVAGYDMAKLHLGALGSLGVITRASFKVAPLAETRRTSRLDGPVDILMSTSLRLAGSGLSINGLILREGTDYCHLDLSFAGGAAAVERSHREVSDLATAAGLSLGEAPPFPDPSQDVVVRAGVLPTATASLCKALMATSASIIAYPTVGIVRGHWPSSQAPSVESLERLRSDCSGVAGGALILEKGPPDLKHSFDVWGPVRSDFGLMRGLKQQFDPQRVLSPGRFLGNL